MNLQTQMKQAVAKAAVDQIQNGMILWSWFRLNSSFDD
tara:strand:+ start:1515 stop:1628 length:114 start_codon:yes stop_codon:yes gene_type:complete